MEPMSSKKTRELRVGDIILRKFKHEVFIHYVIEVMKELVVGSEHTHLDVINYIVLRGGFSELEDRFVFKHLETIPKTYEGPHNYFLGNCLIEVNI